MIELVLQHTDLARIRFAHSPLVELVASVRVLQQARPAQLHRRWAQSVRGRLGSVRMDLLTALIPPAGTPAGFLIPPPATVDPTLDLALSTVEATEPEVVRAALRPLHLESTALYHDPARELGVLIAQLRRYWAAAIAPVWPGIRAVALADLRHRMEQFAGGGVAQVLASLHPDLTYQDDTIAIHNGQSWPRWRERPRDGAGILLAPCVFAWPELVVTGEQRAQPMLWYPPRGVAEAYTAPVPIAVEPLGALVGRTRAAMLSFLELPRTTTQLAQHLNVTPATISQHLKVLKESALVDRQRRGRAVLYQRTTVAATLLEANDPAR
jgi:DNA-binding transcriptional ArsR family regulator